MNDKKVKKLRREAERLTIGLPARELVQWNQQTNDGRESGAALNNPHTTRGVYRELKRQERHEDT